MDGVISMVDLDMPTRPKAVLAGAHPKGVYSFCYVPSLNYIASCGLERTINLWHASITNTPQLIRHS